ncbi:MAG: hypothetical protein QGD89_05670 [Actinomycetota bacterium]|nr:hypothetical protein [Actinomycetota bacterium]
METMTITHNVDTVDVTTLGGAELKALFAAGGLIVEVVANCGDAACPNCSTIEPAHAA